MNKIVGITIRHWQPLLGLNLFIAGAAIVTVVVTPRVWTATAQLILPDTNSHLDANLGTLGSLSNGNPAFSSTQVNPLKVQASILTSDTLLEQARNSDPEKNKFPRLIAYSKLFKVSPQEQSTSIGLSVSGSSPEVARQRAISLIQAYQQRLNELRLEDSKSREHFNQKRLDQARQKLNREQIALSQFQKSSGLLNIAEQTKGVVSDINNLTTAQAQAQAQAQATKNRARALSTRLGLAPEKAIRSLSLSENQDYQFVQRKLVELDATLAQVQTIYSDTHPKVKSLLTQRHTLQRQLQQYVDQAGAGTQVDTTIASGNQGQVRASLIQQLVLAESEASGQQRQAEQLQLQIEKLNTVLRAIPVNQARLQELQRQYDVAEGVYKGLVAQVNQANIDAFNAYPNIQVLDSPKVDQKPSSPKLTLVVLNALLASVLASIALVLLLEGRRPMLNPTDLQASKFPIVMRIPRLRRYNKELALGTETEVEFQRLASAVSLQSLKDRRLLVTSAVMGEGKTTVTLGLARALNDLGFRVLLVDGDLRRASLSQTLGYARKPFSPNQAVQIQPGLDLLPTQPREGKIVELVTQGRFEQGVTAAQSAGCYDYVVIDSAPVNLTSETSLMAAVISNVLFVVRPGTSDRDSVNDSLDHLAQHHAQIIGLVVNDVETNSSYYSYRAKSSLVDL